MSFDDIPIWGVLLATIGLVFVALELGVHFGRARAAKGGARAEVSGAMIGATMGLLAFLMAFTFNGAAGRHEARKALILEEATVIELAWMQAGFLPESQRLQSRHLLLEYVDLRMKAANGVVTVDAAVRASEALHANLWTVALEVGQLNAASIPAGLFIQSLARVIDVHLKRVTVAVRSRVPPMIWGTLYLLMAAAMVMIGAHGALSGGRHFTMELALAMSFSLVLFATIDLDRPQDGLINASQQAMADLQTKLNSQ